MYALASPHIKCIGRAGVAPHSLESTDHTSISHNGDLYFHCAFRFRRTQWLAYMLNSLVRVSRRDVSLHFAKVPNSKKLHTESIAQINHKHSKLSKQLFKRDPTWLPRHVVGTSVSATTTSMPRYNIQTQMCSKYLLDNHLPQRTNWLWRHTNAQGTSKYKQRRTQTAEWTASTSTLHTHIRQWNMQRIRHWKRYDSLSTVSGTL